MVCLDTTFFVDLFRKKNAVANKLQEFADQNITLSTTIMTIAELYHGVYKSNNKPKEEKYVEDILNKFEILQMTEQSAKKYGELSSFLDKKGQKIEARDLLIGAISISEGETTIVTRNAKHFSRIPGLKVLTY